MDGIHAKVAELQKQLEPQGVRIVPYIDRSDLIAATVDKVSHTLIGGMTLVCIVLVLFFGSARGGAIVAVTVPLAMVSIFVLMNAAKMSASMLSLGALDFGVIVDGAIVVTENILRRREAKPAEELTEDDVRTATGQVARPIFFATLIIVTAYFPLFFLQRGEAALFTPMAFTVGFALFGALVCTLALVPGLAYLAFRKPRATFHNKPLEWLGRVYGRALPALLDRPRISYAAVAIAFAFIALLGGTVGRDYLPDLDEGALWLQVQLPSGLSLDAASKMASELRQTVLEFPEVSYVVTQLGREDEAVDAWTPSHIEVPVGLTPYDTWPAGETKADFVRKLNARLQQVPGINVGINQPISDMVYDLIGGAHSQLVIQIFGDDFSETRRIGGAIVDVLRGIRGTAQASIFQEPPLPQIVIEADRAAAARYGINVSDITNLIQDGIGGSAVTQVFVGDRVYNVSVRFPEATRNNPEALGNLTLTTSSGAQVPLLQVATINQRNGESHHHADRQPPQSDRAHRSGRTGSDVVLGGSPGENRENRAIRPRQIPARIWRAIREPTARPGAIDADHGPCAGADDAAALRRSSASCARRSSILGVVPLAAMGGLIALYIRGETLNVATAVGFIALFGVAVQNGIIMVANLNRVRETGRAAARGGTWPAPMERLRPVLMTATVATVGMLPAALATGVGSDVQRNLATVVAGGLVPATLLTLFIIPTFYFAVERWAERRAAAPPARQAAVDVA